MPDLSKVRALPLVVLLLDGLSTLCFHFSAFFPNGELDKDKDKLFETHIAEICVFVSMDHEAIQINPKYRSQAPWTLAQKELQKINVYKSPGDKLDCIMRTCRIIMSKDTLLWVLPFLQDSHFPFSPSLLKDLISFNGKEVGADDFFPVLVFVILQANPRCLLSTVQYIKYFYESKATGEASYWWSQFIVAVEFIKTLNPKQ